VARVVGNRVGLVAAFADAARRYWLTVFPEVCRERTRLRTRAAAIPDPVLRTLALEAQSKWSNIEGAAAFASFSPRPNRLAAVRAAASFQSAYNYLDMLGEAPIEDPALNGRRLHQALLVAVDPDASHQDYYEHYPYSEDNGYLAAMIESTRSALRTLPSYGQVLGAAHRGAERIVAFQSSNTGELQGDHDALERWARAATPAGADLRWWETAASAGSSLGVHVMFAVAARRSLSGEEVEQIDEAYFPWIGALHSMLDNVVDASEDHETDQRSLISYYASPQEAAARMRLLTERSLGATQALPRAAQHELILAAMVSSYLATPESSEPAARLVAGEVLDVLGELARPAMFVFRTRAWVSAHRPGRRRPAREPLADGAGPSEVLPRA
jgi:tetraprenyl-beta-curcumene synthase